MWYLGEHLEQVFKTTPERAVSARVRKSRVAAHALEMLRLRLRGPGGTATGSFDGAASIESFLVAASEQLGCAGAKLDMLVGFPPKQCEISGAPLSSVVGSGDTVVLNVIAAAPDSAADSSSHSDRVPATAGPSVSAALAPAPPSDQHRRPRQGDTHTADANKRQAGPSRSGGPVIYVGGACKDSAGHHALRPAGAATLLRPVALG